jgi:hypothetical protein
MAVADHGRKIGIAHGAGRGADHTVGRAVMAGPGKQNAGIDVCRKQGNPGLRTAMDPAAHQVDTLR